MKLTRRRFFSQFSLKNAKDKLQDAHESFEEDRKARSETSYFDSYENCYPLISEYSYFIDDEVKELGIDTEGKSNLEITQAVYSMKGRSKSD